MRVATAFLFTLVCEYGAVLFSMYSYFRKGCRKAYAPIPLGILAVDAWVLIERQPFLNYLYTAISSKVVAAQVYTPRPQRSM